MVGESEGEARLLGKSAVCRSLFGKRIESHADCSLGCGCGCSVFE